MRAKQLIKSLAEASVKDFIRSERLYLIMLVEPDLPTIPPRYLRAKGAYRHDAVPWVNNEWVADKAAASAFHWEAAKEWIENEKARAHRYTVLTPVPVDSDPRDEANARRWMHGESVVKDFLGKVSNEWTFHSGGRLEHNPDYIRIYFHCNGRPVFTYFYSVSRQGPVGENIKKWKQALEAGDAKEPFRPDTQKDFQSEYIFMDWSRRTGVLPALMADRPADAPGPRGWQSTDEALSARDFIMQQKPPSTWGELKVGDILHGEDGALRVITKQHPRPGYAHVPATLYDEYNPAYSYTERGGPFVQHYSIESNQPIMGELFVGTREDHPGDLWKLMKHLNAKRWPDQCTEAIDPKKFIMRQPIKREWTFKTDRVRERGWDKYMTRIYFRGDNVATTYTAHRPRADVWRRSLERANAVFPFVETPENTFWDWMKFKLRKRLDYQGFRPLREAKDEPVNIRHFIQQFGNTWAFHEINHPEWPDSMRRLIKIFCNGVLVGGIRYRPVKKVDFQWMKDTLEHCDQKALFVPGTDKFWLWLHQCKMTLMPHWQPTDYWTIGVGDRLPDESLLEGIVPKDFIMNEVPSVEGVCKNFALTKTDDEYKGGALLWGKEGDYSHTNSWVIRHQDFKGHVHLGRPLSRHGTLIDHLDIEVGYWEDRWGNHSVRIDIRDMGARQKKIEMKDEAKVAERLERYLDRLVRTMSRMRSTNLATLNRVLAALGFHSS